MTYLNKTMSIRAKLFIAFLLACLLSLSAVIFIFKYTVTDAFLNYVKQQDQEQLTRIESALLEYYTEHLSWDGLQNNIRGLLPFMMGDRTESHLNPPRPPPDWFLPPPHGEHERRRPPQHPMGRSGRFFGRVVLLNAQRQTIWNTTPFKHPHQYEQTLIYESKIVGYLGLYQDKGLSNQVDKEFANRLDYLLGLAAIASLVTTALFSFVLTRHLIKPIQQLSHATAVLTNGHYGIQMSHTSQDELGHLITNFNQLSLRLKENENARKQWIMDIAHELRTPLAILRGEIEALQDGINTPDELTINSLHQEVLHLNRLVDDLYTLSMSDSGALSYHKQPLDWGQMITETIAQFSKALQNQWIDLSIEMPQQPCIIQGDEQRLQQLLQKLLENTLRYTDSPGALALRLERHSKEAVLTLSDSPPSVPAEALPRLFERLYRVETSRNRTTGGTGIGLSIAYNIVKAHQGTIHAQQAALGGLEIVISLPLLDEGL